MKVPSYTLIQFDDKSEFAFFGAVTSVAALFDFLDVFAYDLMNPSQNINLTLKRKEKIKWDHL